MYEDLAHIKKIIQKNIEENQTLTPKMMPHKRKFKRSKMPNNAVVNLTDKPLMDTQIIYFLIWDHYEEELINSWMN